MAWRAPKSVSFRACIYPSSDREGCFVAHCLELDLIGEGRTPQDAVVELIEAIRLQLDACDNASQFFFPAPGRIWQRYAQAKKAKRVFLRRIVQEAVRKASRREYAPHFDTVVATSSVPERYLAASTA